MDRTHTPGVFTSPLSSWFPDTTALARFRRRLGRAPAVLPPRDRAWQSVAPGFAAAMALAASGLPVQIAANRRYARAPDRRRLARAFARGETVFLPQIHQVLPRVMRLMVALRVAFLSADREEASFLFVVRGAARPGMGLHHDGPVDAFWLQLRGRRTVTLGPPVAPGAPEDLPELDAAGGAIGWTTLDLAPGTLFYLPPWTPHRVICGGPSLALSLTWGRPRRRPGARHGERATAELTAWDVASGWAEHIPRVDRTRLWTQVPVGRGAIRAGTIRVWAAGGAELTLPAALAPLVGRLATMPSFRLAAAGVAPEALAPLLHAGLVAPRDLPLRIVPEDASSLDGWRFA